MSLTGEKIPKTMGLLTYNYLRVCFQDKSVLRKVVIVTQHLTPRGKELSDAVFAVYCKYQGDGIDEKLENIQVLTEFLAAAVGGFNGVAAHGKFGKGKSAPLSQQDMENIKEIHEPLLDAISLTVGNALQIANLPYSQKWFAESLWPSTILAYSKAKSLVNPDGSDFFNALVDGMIGNLVGVCGIELNPKDSQGKVIPLPEEAKDSFISDLEENIKSTVLKWQDKWGKYFAEKSASYPKKGR